MEAQSTFQESKQKLYEKALSSFEQLNSNLNSMNRNLETISDIGTQFKAPAHLWNSFHEAVKSSNSTNETVDEPKEITSDVPKPLLIDLEDSSLGEEDRL